MIGSCRVSSLGIVYEEGQYSYGINSWARNILWGVGGNKAGV